MGKGEEKEKIEDDIKNGSHKDTKELARNKKNWRCQWCQEPANGQNT